MEEKIEICNKELEKYINDEEHTKTTIVVTPGKITLSELRTVYQNPIKLILDEEAYVNIRKSRHFINKTVNLNHSIYGINTGIGLLASVRIDGKDTETLQRAIITSHAAGVGDPLEDNLVRLMMFLKINSLARGYSGVREEIIDALIALVNAEIYPRIPLKGSVGASGDLAPLSHMSLILLGEGEARYKGKRIPAVNALAFIGLKPFKLASKEGVALINGTQTSTAFALRGLFDTEDLFAAAIVCGSLSTEAALGSRCPFDSRIHAVRGQIGQIDVANVYRQLLCKSSKISESHSNCNKVQDPYSLRCQPQVMGACLTQIRNVADILLIEANSVTDNPLIFVDQDEAISGGNFHAEPIAMAADNLALVIAEIGSISERRIALLMDKNMTRLPEFLVEKSGLFSGFMTAQVTAAALASENKCLAHPACVDSIPTSGNQEDHVSMAPIAGKRLWEMADNVRGILAIEWLCACQALDMRGELKTTEKLEQARKILRNHVSFYKDDRYIAPDIKKAIDLLADRRLTFMVPTFILPSYDN